MSDQTGNNPESPQTPPAWEPVATPAAYPPPQAQGYPPPSQGYPPPAPGYPPPAGHAQPPYQQPPYPQQGYPQQAAGMSSTSAAAVSYLTFIPAVIFLVIDPYKRDPFVRFHAWQCITLTLAWIVVTILFIPLAFMHLFGMGIMLHLLVRLLFFIVWLIAIIKASRGERWKIPVIGDLAEKFSASV